MLDLKHEQERLYQWLRERNARCFLRVDQSDDALWVTDLPRRQESITEWQQALAGQGIACTMDESGLWHLDWTEMEWNQRLDALPDIIPALPDNEQDHPAYALCRFGLLHPAPRSAESLRFLRKVFKKNTDYRTLHEMAVEACRNGKPIAYDAARVLAIKLGKGE